MSSSLLCCILAYYYEVEECYSFKQTDSDLELNTDLSRLYFDIVRYVHNYASGLYVSTYQCMNWCSSDLTNVVVPS